MIANVVGVAVRDGEEHLVVGPDLADDGPNGILEGWPAPEMDAERTPTADPLDPTWTPHRAGFYDACDGKGFRRTEHSVSVQQSRERDARVKAEHAALVAAETISPQ